MSVWSQFRNTMSLRAFAFWRIPLIHFIRPVVEEMDANVCRIRVPLSRRTKNHLGSMYFGVLSTGADCAGGLLAMQLIRQSKKNVSLVFKDFKAHFLKRAEGDVVFLCQDGPAIRSLVERTLSSSERQEAVVKVTATVPSISQELIAEFELTLSLRNRN